MIPIQGDIEPVHLNNNRSSRTEPEFVRRSIDELLVCGAIVECEQKPFVVTPLTVANKDGKLMLMIDIRQINGSIIKKKCKYDGHDLFPKGDTSRCSI